jgi:adenylate kinase
MSKQRTATLNFKEKSVFNFPRRIAISGVPGCGKSTFAILLAQKLGYDLIEISDVLVRDKSIVLKHDVVRNVPVVSVPRINAYLRKIFGSRPFIVVGHFAHDLAVDCCIVCSCDISVLHKRLQKRGYTVAKIRENLDAQIFDVCYVESLERGLETFKVDTTRKTTQIILDDVIVFLQSV